LKIILTILLLIGFGFGVTAVNAQTNTVPFNPIPTRTMRLADHQAYGRAGGNTNDSDVAIYRWQHYKIVSNGVTYVQTGTAKVVVSNPDYVDYWVGKSASWKYDAGGDQHAASYAAQNYAKSLSESNAAVRVGVLIDIQNIEASKLLTNPPPISLIITQPVYKRFP